MCRRKSYFVIDTHSSNKVGKYLCPSQAKDKVIRFDAKPAAIHPFNPQILEAKSVVTVTKDSVEHVFKNMTLVDRNFTYVEGCLFEQCLERIIEQFQFRAYLSKIIVYGSTGHYSWCFYFTQKYSECYGAPIRQLRIFPLSCDSVNILWNSVCNTVAIRGDSYFLTKEAPMIFSVLHGLAPTTDLHAIRVHLANLSESPVYYVTVPRIGASIVEETDIEGCAIKVVLNRQQFKTEVSMLRKIEESWNLADDFYYYSDSERLCENKAGTLSVRLTADIDRKYCWLKLPKQFPIENGGIIVMVPGSRTKLNDIKDSTGSVFAQLRDSLRVAHTAGILHCDVSPNNCVLFGNCWQVVDYGLAVTGTRTANGDLVGNVTIRRNSYQHLCCGYTAFQLINEQLSKSTADTVTVEWTPSDDFEMLYFALINCPRKPI